MIPSSESSPKKIDSIESISLQTCVEKWSPLTATGKRAQTQSFSCVSLKKWRLWRVTAIGYRPAIGCNIYEWMNFELSQTVPRSIVRTYIIQCTNQFISWIIQLIFTDILAGFTFNNRVLRLPAIVLLNVYARIPEEGPSFRVETSCSTIAGRRRTLLLNSTDSTSTFTNNNKLIFGDWYLVLIDVLHGGFCFNSIHLFPSKYLWPWYPPPPPPPPPPPSPPSTSLK